MVCRRHSIPPVRVLLAPYKTTNCSNFFPFCYCAWCHLSIARSLPLRRCRLSEYSSITILPWTCVFRLFWDGIYGDFLLWLTFSLFFCFVRRFWPSAERRDLIRTLSKCFGRACVYYIRNYVYIVECHCKVIVILFSFTFRTLLDFLTESRC